MKIAEQLAEIALCFEGLSAEKQAELAQIYLDELIPAYKSHTIDNAFFNLRGIYLNEQLEKRDGYLSTVISQDKATGNHSLLSCEEKMLENYIRQFNEAIIENTRTLSQDNQDCLINKKYDNDNDKKNLSMNLKTTLFAEFFYHALYLQIQAIKKQTINADSALHPKTLIEKAKGLYRNYMLKEALYLAELTLLIDHDAFLAFNEANEMHALQSGELNFLVTLNSEIKPERAFLATLLSQSGDIKDFKLSATDNLFLALTSFDNILSKPDASEKSIDEKYQDFLSHHGNDVVDIQARNLGNIQARTIRQYFQPENDTIAPNAYFTSIKARINVQLATMENDLDTFDNFEISTALSNALKEKLSFNTLAKKLQKADAKTQDSSLLNTVKKLKSSLGSNNKATRKIEFFTKHFNFSASEQNKKFLLNLIDNAAKENANGASKYFLLELKNIASPSFWTRLPGLLFGVNPSHAINTTDTVSSNRLQAKGR